MLTLGREVIAEVLEEVSQSTLERPDTKLIFNNEVFEFGSYFKVTMDIYIDAPAEIILFMVDITFQDARKIYDALAHKLFPILFHLRISRM